ELFVPSSLEKTIMAFRRFGIDQVFQSRDATGARGMDYALAVHLASLLVHGSMFVAARYLSDPAETLRAIVSVHARLHAHPEEGLHELSEKLESVDTHVFVENDLTATVSNVHSLHRPRY